MRRHIRRGNIRRLLKPKVVTQLKERPIGVDCRRCDGRLGNGGKVWGNVCFFCPASRTSKRHTGSTGRKPTLDHAPLGPNCRYSESEPPPFSALFVSYKSWGRYTHLLRYRSSSFTLSHWLCPVHRVFTGSPTMLASSPVPVDNPAESLALYSQSLRDYTLRLWVESRRQADERVHHDGRNRKKSHGTPMPTSTRKPSDDGNSSTGTSNDGLTLSTDGPHA